jgi:predicted ATPase
MTILKEPRLKNFKSFADEQTIPFAPMTVFVGANGSGKSNALDAIRFLQGFHQGLSLTQVLDGHIEGGRVTFPGVRGGINGLAWNSSSPTSVSFILEFCVDSAQIESQPTPEGHNSDCIVRHDLRFDVFMPKTTLPSIASERLSVSSDGSERELVKARHYDQPGPNIEFRAGANTLMCNESHFLASTLTQVDFDDDDVSGSGPNQDGFETSAKWARQIVRNYRRSWGRIRQLDLQPDEMSGYADIRSVELESNGRNISGVVRHICQNTENKRRLIEWVSALCSPRVEDIEFIETEAGDVLLQVFEDVDQGRPISPKSLSDGTLRFLGLLAAVFSVPEGTTLILEEIENGLHPHRVHLLVELFEQFAAERKI